MKLARTCISALAACALAAALVPAAALASVEAPAVDVAETAAVCAPIPAEEDAYVPDELIVTFDEGYAERADAQAPEELLEENVELAQDVEVLADADAADADVVKLELEEGVDLAAVQEDVAQLPGVACVQPNYRYRNMDTLIATTNDTQLSAQYYLESGSKHGVNARAAWVETRCEHDVAVAVFDTGFDFAHEDLADNMLQNLAWDAYHECELAVGSTTGYVKHGSHVAGIIAASANNALGVAGVSYNANVLPIKVFDKTGKKCDTEKLMRAYNHIFELLDAGAIDNLHVVNLSLGGYDYDDDALEAIVTKARRDYDLVTVCSGGNGYLSTDDEVKSGRVADGQPRTDRCLPGDYDACVSVTALTKSGANCTWSDYNKYKDISAPGESILSTLSESSGTSKKVSRDYGALSGTSVAAPIVSGTLALLWAQNPNITVDQALRALYNTAVPVTGNDRRSVSGSHGCVNAAAAAASVKGMRSLENASITIPDAMYFGSAVKPAPVVVYAGTTLEKGIDYKVSYTNNNALGTATATITGLGMYSGKVYVDFEVVKPVYVAMSKVNVSVADVLFTGEKLKPKVTVSYAGTKLVQGTEYKVSYSNNRKVGTGKVKVVGKRQYTGSVTKTFAIKLPKAVSKVKKSRVKGLKVKAKSGRRASVSYKKTIYATSYQVAVKRVGAPHWQHANRYTRSVGLGKLAAGKHYRVKVRACIVYAGKTYYGKWSVVKTFRAKR